MRFPLIFFLALSLTLPSIPVDGLLLVCPEGDKGPMALHECCCMDASSAPECKLLRLADCCCEIRPDWQIDTEDREVVVLPASRLDSPSLYLAQQLVVFLENRLLSTTHRPEGKSKSDPPHSLYLLYRSLLI